MDAVTIEAIGRFIATVGFPTAIAVYLIRWVSGSLNGKLDRLSSSVDRNTTSVDKLSDRVDRLIERQP